MFPTESRNESRIGCVTSSAKTGENSAVGAPLRLPSERRESCQSLAVGTCLQVGELFVPLSLWRNNDAGSQGSWHGRDRPEILRRLLSDQRLYLPLGCILP